MASQLAQLDPAQLSKLPTIPPPPGGTIDFDGPNPLETSNITVTTVFMGLAFLLVGIRAYTKIKIKGSWSWDDRKIHACITRGGQTLTHTDSNVCAWSCESNQYALQPA